MHVRSLSLPNSWVVPLLLLFTDNTIVFYEASQDQMTYLYWLLLWFKAILGLRINLDKSELVPVGRVM